MMKVLLLAVVMLLLASARKVHLRPSQTETAHDNFNFAAPRPIYT